MLPLAFRGACLHYILYFMNIILAIRFDDRKLYHQNNSPINLPRCTVACWDLDSLFDYHSRSEGPVPWVIMLQVQDFWHFYHQNYWKLSVPCSAHQSHLCFLFDIVKTTVIICGFKLIIKRTCSGSIWTRSKIITTSVCVSILAVHCVAWVHPVSKNQKQVLVQMNVWNHAGSATQEQYLRWNLTIFY
jgi:hypothetical protein